MRSIYCRAAICFLLLASTAGAQDVNADGQEVANLRQLVGRLESQVQSQKAALSESEAKLDRARHQLTAHEQQEQSDAVAVIEKLGGKVLYDYQRPSPDVPNVYDPKAVPSDPSGPHWVVYVNLSDTKITDSDLSQLESLPYLENLTLTNTAVTSAGLVHLRGLTSLRFLGLWKTSVTDEGLQHLTHLTKLWALILDGTHISDAGLVHLKDLTNLENWLGLTGTQVTDEGLKQLSGLKKLKSLNVLNTEVTAAGVKELQTALPETEISYDR